jgi:hypothetical protein
MAGVPPIRASVLDLDLNGSPAPTPGCGQAAKGERKVLPAPDISTPTRRRAPTPLADQGLAGAAPKPPPLRLFPALAAPSVC